MLSAYSVAQEMLDYEDLGGDIIQVKTFDFYSDSVTV
jgi:hypothetical protein